MAEVFLVIAVLLMIVGVIGSFVPLLPGAMLSIIGVLVYWWSTGYTSPGLIFLLLFILLGLFAVLVDYFAGAISAKAGGASNTTTLIAAIAGLIFLFILGPIGVIIGTGLTVFLLEFWRKGETEGSLKAALYATIGVLSSALVQFLITLSLLIGFIFVLIF